ncbi:uncharacterized protein LOC129219637 [Uloborus diversus]|uniref:uncharacterized protein LOC129219637 n=1 Tax=Uloborus diversus TaxID=327109 RepID=UPI002409F62A|nr:uncharacterized protein LOC129219637 [Uloborus diversus]
MASNALNFVILFVVCEFVLQINAIPWSQLSGQNKNEPPRLVSPGFAFIALIAFVLFIILMVLIVFYKRDKGIRGNEKTLFLTPY